MSLRCLAFYLPQYHPIPENDEWWGRGFTDWANVAAARPRFRGHRQPRIPTDLGFYDLRLPEARAAQAELAGAFGVDGFCYYHYWFSGRRLLERPFAEVLESGDPDFPFCLCWANESWTRAWNGRDDQALVTQEYSPADDLAHIRWLAAAFADRRYVRVDGRPLLLVYRASRLPDSRRTTDCWREECVRLGVSEPYLVAVRSFESERVDPASLGFDASVQFAPGLTRMSPAASAAARGFRRLLRPASPRRTNLVADYADAVSTMLEEPDGGYKRYPCVSPGFDNSPRRRQGAAILVGSDPQSYGRWVEEAAGRFTPYSREENLIFVNAWNEWAEGNHLEPCDRWGRSFLEAHARAMAPYGGVR